MSSIKKSLRKIKKFHFVLYNLLIIVASILFLINFPKAINLVQTKISSENLNPEKRIEVTREQKKIINHEAAPPTFTASSVLTIDLESKKILFEKNKNKRVPIASTTKIVTALVASDYFKSANTLTVPKEALVGGSSMGLSTGEVLTFRSLLYGMLLNSGNDAAYAIALNYPGGMDGFVGQMNQKASQLGLLDTHFTNPAGFDDSDHYSSASDLSTIAVEVAENSQLARVVSTKQTQILSWDKTKKHDLKNLNKLLSEEGVLGIKTGFTEKSGENLVTLVERKNQKVLIVLLGSLDRFGETKQLIDWVYSNYEWSN